MCENCITLKTENFHNLFLFLLLLFCCFTVVVIYFPLCDLVCSINSVNKIDATAFCVDLMPLPFFMAELSFISSAKSTARGKSFKFKFLFNAEKKEVSTEKRLFQIVCLFKKSVD